MERYMRSAPYGMIHLCLDAYDDKQFIGKAYNPTVKEPIEFKDINEFFLQIDELFDRNGNPMSGSVKRQFKGVSKRQGSYQRRPPLVCDYETLLGYQGKALTLDFVVLTRHSVTWQGYVFDQNETYAFKDVLDIYRIINKILKARQNML